MAPRVCTFLVIDGFQCALSGVCSGCGWQDIGAYINLAAFYLFGIPIAVALAFRFQLRGKGLWIGVLLGATIQTVMLAIKTASTNWQEQATKARERVLQEGHSLDGNTPA